MMRRIRSKREQLTKSDDTQRASTKKVVRPRRDPILEDDDMPPDLIDASPFIQQINPLAHNQGGTVGAPVRKNTKPFSARMRSQTDEHSDSASRRTAARKAHHQTTTNKHQSTQIMRSKTFKVPRAPGRPPPNKQLPPAPNQRPKPRYAKSPPPQRQLPPPSPKQSQPPKFNHPQSHQRTFQSQPKSHPPQQQSTSSTHSRFYQPQKSAPQYQPQKSAPESQQPSMQSNQLPTIAPRMKLSLSDSMAANILPKGPYISQAPVLREPGGSRGSKGSRSSKGSKSRSKSPGTHSGVSSNGRAQIIETTTVEAGYSGTMVLSEDADGNIIGTPINDPDSGIYDLGAVGMDPRSLQSATKLTSNDVSSKAKLGAPLPDKNSYKTSFESSGSSHSAALNMPNLADELLSPSNRVTSPPHRPLTLDKRASSPFNSIPLAASAPEDSDDAMSPSPSSVSAARRQHRQNSQKMRNKPKLQDTRSDTSDKHKPPSLRPRATKKSKNKHGKSKTKKYGATASHPKDSLFLGNNSKKERFAVSFADDEGTPTPTTPIPDDAIPSMDQVIISEDREADDTTPYGSPLPPTFNVTEANKQLRNLVTQSQSPQPPSQKQQRSGHNDGMPTLNDMQQHLLDRTTQRQALQDLRDMMYLYEQAIDDVNQAIVDVKETSHAVKYVIRSSAEAMKQTIIQREMKLADDVTKMTAKKIFALEQQFTGLTQRLQFCRDTCEEASSVMEEEREFMENLGQKSSKGDRSRDSVVNYRLRKDRIMKIMDKATTDAEVEFETGLNRGTPIVSTRFRFVSSDLTCAFEKWGSILGEKPIPEYQLLPPAITDTKAFNQSLRLKIKSREQTKHGIDYIVLACQCEPQLVFTDPKNAPSTRAAAVRGSVTKLQNSANGGATHHRRNSSLNSLPDWSTHPEKLEWLSLGWCELNPAPPVANVFVHHNDAANIQSDTDSDGTLNPRSEVGGDTDDSDDSRVVTRGDTNRSSQSSTRPSANSVRQRKNNIMRAQDEHISYQYDKLITGLGHLLGKYDGSMGAIDDKSDKSSSVGSQSAKTSPDTKQHVYLRVRIKKCVKFFDRKINKKIHHRAQTKALAKQAVTFADEEDDEPAIWIESHFSRPVRIRFAPPNSRTGNGSVTSAFGSNTLNNPLQLPPNMLIPESDIDMSDAAAGFERNISYSRGTQIEDYYPSDCEALPMSRPRPIGNPYGAMEPPRELPTKPGVLAVAETSVIWHDSMSGAQYTMSSDVPVGCREYPGVVIAHDVLVVDRPDSFADDSPISTVPTEIAEEEGRYTSIVFRCGGNLNGKPDRSVDTLDLGTGQWSALPPMNEARSWCPVVLINGNVVVLGGYGKGSNSLGSVELFDFEQGQWVNLSPMSHSRWGHAAFVYHGMPDRMTSLALTDEIINTKVLIAGGWSRKKTSLRNAEMYDVMSDSWTKVSPMNVGRSGCVACRWTGKSKVGIVGGWGANLRVVETYDGNKDKWTRLSDLNHEHVYPSAGLLTDQQLKSLSNIEASAGRYLTKRQKWIEKQLKKKRNQSSHKISALRGRPMPYVMGSNDQLSCTEMYDERTNKWIILQRFPHGIPLRRMLDCSLPSSVLDCHLRTEQQKLQAQLFFDGSVGSPISNGAFSGRVSTGSVIVPNIEHFISRRTSRIAKIGPNARNSVVNLFGVNQPSPVPRF